MSTFKTVEKIYSWAILVIFCSTVSHGEYFVKKVLFNLKHRENIILFYENLCLHYKNEESRMYFPIHLDIYASFVLVLSIKAHYKKDNFFITLSDRPSLARAHNNTLK